MLVGPQLAGLRVQRAAPAGSGVRSSRSRAGRPRCSDKRIVVRHAAVGLEADRNPVMVRRVLRGMRRQVSCRARHPIAHRDEQVSVAVPGEPPPVVAPPLRLRLEDVFDGREPVVFEPASDDRRRRAFSLRPRVAQIQQAVGREVGVREHLEQPSLPPSRTPPAHPEPDRAATSRRARRAAGRGVR